MHQEHSTKFKEIRVEFKEFKRNYLGGFEAQGSSFLLPLWSTSTDAGDSSGELWQSEERQRKHRQLLCAEEKRKETLLVAPSRDVTAFDRRLVRAN